MIIDPIDGSLNAKRGLPTTRCRSPWPTATTMADVAFGFVHDFGPGEQWWAWRGEGAWLDGERLDPALAERRARDGRLEVLGDRVGRPALDRSARSSDLGDGATGCARWARSPRRCARWPPPASTAWSRCGAAAAVDAAAGQLIVREAGGLVSFPGLRRPARRTAGREPHSRRVVAARSPETLAQLADGSPA